MNHMKSTYLIICGWSSFPLNPAWGKLKTTLSNRLILRSVWSFIVFAFTPCKITAPNFLRSAKLDSASLYFFFRVSAKDHLENNGNQIKYWSQTIVKCSSFDLSETNFRTIQVYVSDRILEMQFKRYQYLIITRLVLQKYRRLMYVSWYWVPKSAPRSRVEWENRGRKTNKP